MSIDLPTNANIEIADGPYYQVKLEFVPRVGDTIEFYSFLDAVGMTLEVTGVKHQIRDVVEKIEQSHKGHHFVTVLTKRVS
jgi:hypothetical protein